MNDTVRIMTRNLYQELRPLVIVTNPESVAGATAAYNMIQASKPANARPRLHARSSETALTSSAFRKQPLSARGHLWQSPPPRSYRTNLVLLLDALERLGER